MENSDVAVDEYRKRLRKIKDNLFARTSAVNYNGQMVRFVNWLLKMTTLNSLSKIFILKKD